MQEPRSLEGNRTFLVRCVADGLYRTGSNGRSEPADLLALTVAERVVEHLDRLGFVVLRPKQRSLPEA